MTSSLKLVIFDVDGTLVDSQYDIVSCMNEAFAAAGLPAPDRASILSIVGLSLPQAIAHLAKEAAPTVQDEIVATYKAAFARRRQAGSGHSLPLFPGARAALDGIHAVPHWLLGIATGKSRRGLNALLDGAGLGHLFLTKQVADDHPSKPHPSMITTALSETGVAPGDAVVIGDTRFDMDMAAAAGVPFIGVSWGYHAAETLTESIGILDRFEDLKPILDTMWGIGS